MPKRNRYRERTNGTLKQRRAAQGEAALHAILHPVVETDDVLSDAAWVYARRNGNPAPAPCGGVHPGSRCCSCGDGYCCYQL